MKEKRKQKGSALPPIPADTAEGIRVHAIAETFRALNKPTEDSPCGLTLQTPDIRIMAHRLRVPLLFIEMIYDEGMADVRMTDSNVEEYLSWRHELAGKAVR